ncbi:MAG TPA: hypothetical protein VFI25_16325 [Planctomycetota bacterium]|jgi:predicted nuclease with TOPRIM domain|nr:hypothetical protein [Planctomycetota bacterium]
MSPIGRIFIVVNLVLSAAFLGWAGGVLAKSDEFKTKFMNEQKAHSDTKAALKKEIEGVKGERDETKQSLAAVREERGRLEGDADRLGKELAAAKEENAQLRAGVGSIDAKLGDFQQNLKQSADRIAELDRERDKLRDEREKAVAAQTAAETEKNDAVEAVRRSKETLASLEEQVAALTKERDESKFRFDQIVEKTGVSIGDLVAQPLIQANVLKVLRDAGLVALNVGSEQGVKRGFTFDVWRGGTFKGRVVVSSVDKGFSSGEIKFLAPNQTIEEGDRAATRIP